MAYVLRFGGGLLSFRRLDASQDNVVAAEALDLLLGLVAGPFADREHGDDRAYPENNAEHGQQAAEPVVPQALESQLNHTLGSQ